MTFVRVAGEGGDGDDGEEEERGGGEPSDAVDDGWRKRAARRWGRLLRGELGWVEAKGTGG